MRTPVLSVLAFVVAACAPRAAPPSVRGPAPAPASAVGLPPVPATDGSLAIRVVYPTPDTPLPSADSSFVFGSVGTGRARLAIDGQPVEVAPNGAFLAYVPVPRGGTYRLAASASGQPPVTATASYRAPPPPPLAPAPLDTATFAPPVTGRIVRGADTLATGSDVAIGRPTPTGTYRWFLPRGAQVTVSGRRAKQFRVRLANTVDAWFADSLLALSAPTPTAAALAAGPVILRPDSAWTDVRIPAGHAPFLVEADGRILRVTLYGPAPGEPPRLASDSLVTGGSWAASPPGTARLELRLAEPVWGYKAFYDPGGALTLRIRRPPRIDPGNPLRRIRIAVDPGHPPAGATGPTGLREAQANLAVGLRLAERLRERGAEVLLTRSADTAVGLGDRPEMAERWNADLLISLHNNAFPDGTNPFLNQGTSTYYFQPWSAPLARALDREIVSVTRIPDLGAKWGNLALVRPTWMPSVLTESLFMMFPRQEAALRNPEFVDRLAEAHVRGIESFLIGRLQEDPGR